MKKLFVLSGVLLGLHLHSQNYYTITFDGYGPYENSAGHSMYRDTLSNPGNIWQIGHPQKTVFNAFYEPDNALVTDTLNYYPVNDTSSFIIKHVADLGFAMPADVYITADYFVDSDTLVDVGTFDFSADNGATWIDLLNDTTYSADIMWAGNKPVFSGRSGGWQSFQVHIAQLGPALGINYHDTVLFRFRFMSDGINTNKDGLMYDNIDVQDDPPIGITTVSGQKSELLITPSPASTSISSPALPLSAGASIVEIYDAGGRCVKRSMLEAGASLNEDISSFADGIFLLRITSGNGTMLSGRFVKN